MIAKLVTYKFHTKDRDTLIEQSLAVNYCGKHMIAMHTRKLKVEYILYVKVKLFAILAFSLFTGHFNKRVYYSFINLVLLKEAASFYNDIAALAGTT